MKKEIVERFEQAKKVYAKYGVNVENALKKFDTIAVSIHCWSGDDIIGFEGLGPQHSQNVVTGSYPYRARTGEELRNDIDEACRYSPLLHRVNLHSMYAEKQNPRNDLTIEDFREWVDWAKEKNYGIDFNTSFFTHPMMDGNNSLTSLNKEVRDYWIKAGKDSRKIAADIGRELNNKCYNNFWFPDGIKDIPADRRLYRKYLKDGLDEIFKAPYTKEEEKYAADVLEGKLFGIGTESFVVGSHDFYLAYAVKNNIGVTMDMGHYHPTEEVHDKISAVRPFVKDLMIHVSRGIRWDSDHVVIENDALNNLMLELKRGDYYDSVALGLDFFDSSINRIYEWVIGLRSTAKAILLSLLDPTTAIQKAELEGNNSLRLFLNEERNNLPFNDVWNYLLAKKGIPTGLEVDKKLRDYEENVLKQRS